MSLIPRTHLDDLRDDYESHLEDLSGWQKRQVEILHEIDNRVKEYGRISADITNTEPKLNRLRDQLGYTRTE